MPISNRIVTPSEYYITSRVRSLFRFPVLVSFSCYSLSLLVPSNTLRTLSILTGYGSVVLI
jgi:hypothetical protein